LPLIIVPIIMLIFIPGLVTFLPALEGVAGSSSSDMAALLRQIPPRLQAELAGFNDSQSMVYLMVVYFLAPMYLIIPLMTASVIAADSFVGEKERKTLEGLLYTPTTDYELFLAKALVAFVPAVIIAWAGFVLYTVVVNLAGWPTMGRLFFPNLMWFILALWVAPAVAGLGLSVTVLVSARSSSFQEASQISGLVVLPLVLLVVSQATGVMYLSLWLVALLGLVAWVIDGCLLWFGGRIFQRDNLAGRL
jgi:ABC-type Na+ efflux pump permease subunit